MPLAELLVLCTAPSGDCDFRSEVSSGFPALNISLPCLLFSFPFCNHLMHITHFVQLSCHCLRIRFLRPQKAFTAHRVPWPPFSSSPRPRHMNAPCRAGTAPSGDCEFRSGASSGVPALCQVAGSVPSTSVFHASSATCNLATTSIIIHFVQLSNHCLQIQPLHPHRASGKPPLVVLWSSKKTVLRQGVCVWNF